MARPRARTLKEQKGGIIEAPRVIRRVAEKPVQVVPRSRNTVSRLATLKRRQAMESARVRRQTQKKAAVKKIQNASKLLKKAEQQVARKMVQARQVAPTTVRRKANTANQRAAKLKNALNQRKLVREQSKQLARQEKMANFAQAATIIHRTQEVRAEAHSYQLKQDNSVSSVGADKQRASYDLHYKSFEKSLRAPFVFRKKRNPGTDYTVVKEKQNVETSNRDSLTTTIQVEQARADGLLKKAQTAGNDALLQAKNRDATNDNVLVLKVTIRLVSPELMARQKQKNLDSGESTDMSKTIDAVSRTPTYNKLSGAVQKRDAADSGRRSEANNAEEYDAAARASREDASTVEGLKASAKREGIAEVTRDLPSISAKRATDAQHLDDSTNGVNNARKLHNDDVDLLTRAITTEGEVLRDISTTEGAEGPARDTYDDALADHGENLNTVDNLSQSRDTLTRELSMLTKLKEGSRLLAINSLPVSSVRRTTEVMRQEQLKSQMTELDIRLASFKDKLSKLLEKRKAVNDNKADNDALVYRNTVRLLDLRGNLAKAKDKLPQAKQDHETHVEREAAFSKEAAKQEQELYTKRIAKNAVDIHMVKQGILEQQGFKALSAEDKNAPVKGKVVPSAKLHAMALKRKILRKRAPRQKGRAEDPATVEAQLKDAERRNQEELDRLEAATLEADGKNRLAKEAGDDAANRLNDKEITSGLERIDVEALALYGPVTKVIKSEEYMNSQKELAKSKIYDEERVKAAGRRKAAERRRDDADDARGNQKLNQEEYVRKADEAAVRAKEEQAAKDLAENRGPDDVETDPTAAIRNREKAEKDLDDAEDANNRAEEEHANNQDKTEDAEGDKDDNDQDINDTENQLNDAEGDLNDADDIHNHDNYTEGELIKKRDALEKEIERLKTDIPRAQRRAESWYPYSSERREKLQTKLENLRKRREEAEIEIESARKALAKMKAQREAYKKMMEERDTLRKEEDNLTKEYEDNLTKINDLEARMARALADGDTSLYNRILKERDDLLERNRIIQNRLEEIRRRLNDIENDIELRRLKKERAEKMKKKREEEEKLQQLRKKQDDHEKYVQKMRSRAERVGVVLGFLLVFIMPVLAALMAPPSKTSTQSSTSSYGPTHTSTNTPTPTRTPTPTYTGTPAASGPQQRIETTYPDDVQVIVNLLCKSGTSDYLRGCAEGTVKGVADGKYDGTKDQVAHYNRILPLTIEQIGIAVDTVATTFKQIEKEAYCTQIENEAQAEGLTSEQIFSLYPECKVTSINGEGPSYGDRFAKNLKPNVNTQSGGSFTSSSIDYQLGWLEAYRYAYLQSYANAWVISKLNNKPKDIPIRPFPLEEKPKYGYGYGPDNYGPTGTPAPSGPVIEEALDVWERFLRQLNDATKKAQAAAAAQRLAAAAAEAAAQAAEIVEATALSFAPEIVRRNFYLR